jgi:hypothetical protein
MTPKRFVGGPSPGSIARVAAARQFSSPRLVIHLDSRHVVLASGAEHRIPTSMRRAVPSILTTAVWRNKNGRTYRAAVANRTQGNAEELTRGTHKPLENPSVLMVP